MSSRPSAQLRRDVITRAANRCEYCLLHQEDVVSNHQVDHVIAEKHGGQTVFENLALSCMTCNLRKSSDISSIDPDSGAIVPLFNPRDQSWKDHFQINGVNIDGRTVEGRTTVKFLQLNSYERLAERIELAAAGRFPPDDHSL